MKSDEELRKASKDVVYEMTMLVGIPKRYSVADSDIVRNALLESFAVHARQLEQFLYDQKGKKNQEATIGACDFFDNEIEQWKKRRPREEADMKELVDRVGVEIAHLKWARSRPDKDWDMKQIVEKIIPICDQFLGSVLPSRIDPTYRSLYEKYRNEYRNWIAEPKRLDGPQSSGIQFGGPQSSGIQTPPKTNLAGKTCPPNS